MQIINFNNLDTQGWCRPRTLIVYSTRQIDHDSIRKLQNDFPNLSIFGTSSYHGIFTPNGYERGSYGFLVDEDDAVDLQPIILPLSDKCDVKNKVKSALLNEIQRDALPSHIIIHATMGFEERVIEGIHDVYDNRVQIFGATAANDKFLSRPFVFKDDVFVESGVLLIAVFGNRFQCIIEQAGYLPTQKSGIITKARGRTILSIDGKPAADVYDDWTDHLFTLDIHHNGILPRSAALYPLGCDSLAQDCGHFWLAHPYKINPTNRSIDLYSELEVGSRVILMRSSADLLVDQAGKTFHLIMRGVDRSRIRTAFVMYCAGCASIIAENMPTVCDKLKKEMGDIPFIGLSSFGEQGRLEQSQRDYHGNMMIVFLLIQKRDDED